MKRKLCFFLLLYVRMQPIYVWSQVGSYKTGQVEQRHQKSGLSVRPTFLFYLAEKNSYMAVYALWSGLYCAIPGMGQVRSGICWAVELWGWVRMVRWGKVGQDVMGLMQRYTSACIPIFRYRWLKLCNISITSMYASHGPIYIGLKNTTKIKLGLVTNKKCQLVNHFSKKNWPVSTGDHESLPLKSA